MAGGEILIALANAVAEHEKKEHKFTFMVPSRLATI